MNKETRSKLKMERPEYYDNTESKAAIIQKSVLREILNKSHGQGIRLGAFAATPGLLVALLIPLITVKEENFDEFLGIGGAVWRALLILFLLVAIGTFVFSGLRVVRSKGWKRPSIEEFFDESRNFNRNRSTESSVSRKESS